MNIDIHELMRPAGTGGINLPKPAPKKRGPKPGFKRKQQEKRDAELAAFAKDAEETLNAHKKKFNRNLESDSPSPPTLHAQKVLRKRYLDIAERMDELQAVKEHLADLYREIFGSEIDQSAIDLDQ